MTINCVKHGQGSPLVFFHGWGFDNQIWASLVPYLADDYQLLLVDLPGFGLTPWMEWDAFKSQLLSQLPQTFALIGWSMGGLCATRLATEQPTRVTSLVNIASTPKFIADATWPGVEKTIFQQFYNRLKKDAKKTLQDFIALQTYNSLSAEITLTQMPSMDGLQQGLKLLETWDFRETIKELSLPALYMFGRLDSLVPIRSVQVMQALYPQFQYTVFRKAAHMPFLSHRDIFIKELRDFLS